MRTIEGLYREIRKMDPGSEISKHFKTAGQEWEGKSC